MAKVVYAALKNSTPRKKPDSVTTKRVTDPDGKTMTVYTVNADSSSFGNDLSYAFGRNVAKVRENDKRDGRDSVPPKG